MVARAWCAKCRYPGKAEFLMGTVLAEREMEALAAIVEMADQHLPSRPEILSVVPGALIFFGGDSDA